MISFKNRTNQLELLDAPNIPTKDLYQNLKELHTINSLLGGYNVMIKGIERLLKDVPPNKEIKILDIGSGGGDTLKVIHRKLSKKYNLKLYGVDLKKDCIDYASENCKKYDITFILSDYRDLIDQELEFDIVVSSLFCHHLTNHDLVNLFQWMHTHAKIGAVVNDLHRHPLAYYSIQWLTKLISKSYLVKNDAPLSVARSFKRNDFSRYLKEANITKHRLTWFWAFRWLLTFNGKNND
ncbi:methyltransferase domain-containing protein [Flammeovirga pacifica]|uniref:Methyltransferase domain-containing protein n=1 Tax=Flammeovirga pacifica TaxID=915059 RepID=A0A1S1YTM3_FLAPC|nr:methyltransferase domain-containing protein [Flammeovirga pacifica]OHX64369.1 hypothetical protein NH26_22515 [Flammeovirga pacifica]